MEEKGSESLPHGRCAGARFEWPGGPILTHRRVWVSDLSFPTPAALPTSTRTPLSHHHDQQHPVPHPHTFSPLGQQPCSAALPSQAAEPDLNEASSCSPPLFPSYLPLATTAAGLAAPSLLTHPRAGQARRLGGAAAALANRDFPSAPSHGRSHAPRSLASSGGGLGEALGCLGGVCSVNSHFPISLGKRRSSTWFNYGLNLHLLSDF